MEARMWPYLAAAVVALGGLWKLVAILRCNREDIPDVASAITSIFITLQLPWIRRDPQRTDRDGPALPQPPVQLPPDRPPPTALPSGQNPAEPS
jgi:hypothetical protein